jgi:hypothetical protein
MNTDLPEGFPDLIVYKLRDILRDELSTDPNYPADLFLTRAIRPNDPTRTVCVIQGPGEPVAYEMRGQHDPAIMEWNIDVTAFVKARDELEGRNIRTRLLNRLRKAIFLNTTVQSLMTLNDGTERVCQFRLRRIDFDAATARDASKQLFFLGSIELVFQTERI